MQAAARAAKDKGTLPPQLWKRRICGRPTYTEFDRMSYRQLITGIALENVYTVVEAWAKGKLVNDVDGQRYYARLVGDGITGRGID